MNTAPTPDVRELHLANLAIGLLPAPKAGGHDYDDLKMAVRTATQLLEEASKPLKQEAYELFKSDEIKSLNELADIFEDWKDLKSVNTVTKNVLELLDLLHRDIEKRRTVIAIARRQRMANRFLPDAGEETAKESIKALLLAQGMDTEFGSGIQGAVDGIWSDIVERWLATDKQWRQALESDPAVSEELFHNICPEIDYREYLANRYPQRDFSAAAMLDIIMWLDRRFRRLKAKAWKEHLPKLVVLGHWLERLLPRSIRLASPLGELTHAIGRLKGSTKTPIKTGLDTTISRMSEIWASVRLGELSARVRDSLTSAPIRDILAAWENLPASDQKELSEPILWEPRAAIDTLARFIEGSEIYLPMILPFQRTRMNISWLSPYQKKLDALSMTITALEHLESTLSAHGGGVAKQLREAMSVEQASITDLDLSLVDTDSAESNDGCDRAEKLLDFAVKTFSPGRIRPYPLFRYAAQRGWKRELLARDRLAIPSKQKLKAVETARASRDASHTQPIK